MFFLFSFVFLPLSKRIIKNIVYKYRFFKINVKILGDKKHTDLILKEFNDNWYLGLMSCKNQKYEMMIISSKYFSKDKLEKVLYRYSQLVKDVFVIPYLDSLDMSHSKILDYSNIKISAIHLENRLLNIKNLIIKYIFEIILVIFSMPLIIILHILISFLIKIDSKGKIFFKQKRMGKDGKVFTVYKYRTMFEDQSELLSNYLSKNPSEIEYYEKYHKYKNDPRITKIGRFLRSSSLDEFPQFYNILMGDMNLIGPRPYMLSENNKIGRSTRNLILKVKPGLTGLWQVSGRNQLSFKRRLELDKWYIQNWSLWMDFVIFLKTIKVVLLKIGAK